MSRVLARPRMAAALGISILLHAVGHAALALAAGASARALVSTFATVEGLLPGVAAKVGIDAALRLGVVGLTATVVKAASGTHASYMQALLAAEAGSTLRLQVLDAYLGHEVERTRPADQGPHPSAAGDCDGPTAGPLARGVAGMTAHVREVEAGMRVAVVGGVRAAAQLVPLGVLLAVIEGRLAAVAFGVLAPFAVLLSGMRRRWKRAHHVAARGSEAMVEAADEAIRHADLWRTYGAAQKVRAHVAELGDALGRGAARVEAGAALLSGTNEVLAALALVLALMAARAGWIEGGGADGGALIAFAATFFLAYRPLRDLGDARLAWGRATAAFDALGGLLTAGLQEGAMVAHSSAPAARAWSTAPLDVQGLRLARGASGTCSFRVEPGEIVAIVGANGAGKTTLLRTLLGLDAPLAGRIIYDDEDLTTCGAGPNARPFAWVPQDAPLLADTLEANVALGDGNERAPASAAPLLAALGATRLVAMLQGARLAAGGRSVSGGERQHIALARALATRQPVLLLDEPTSGLDPAAQEEVLASIARLRGTRSVLLVTHRPEPLAIADAVVRM